MAKFYEKPKVIEAVQYAPNMEVLPDGVYEEWTDPDQTGYCTAYVRTSRGSHISVKPGDWFIKGTRYPCSPDVFAKLYESVYT